MRPIALFTLLVACGSRSALDGGDLPAVGAAGGGGAAGSIGAGGATVPGRGGAAGSGGATVPGRGGAAGSGGSLVPPIGGRDSGLILPGLDASIGPACASCVVAQCPTVAACATNPACLDGVACAVSRCLADGGGLGNLVCLSSCFGGNFQLALGAVSAITCITQGCGPTCGLGP